MSSFPGKLPPNVHLILSTTSNHPTFAALQALTTCLPQSSAKDQVAGGDVGQCFIEVQPLNHEVGVGLVQEWLRHSGRDLTKHQLRVVNDALKQCCLPLYTSLVFEEVGVMMIFFSFMYMILLYRDLFTLFIR